MKCSRIDCENAGVVSANHDAADYYCEQHGRCNRCGGSVADFKFCADLSAWLCPCVIERRDQPEKPRPEPAPMSLVFVGEKAKTARDHWQRSA